jgi:outer membrane murein-binding lipoprotein Lpp
MAFTVSDFQDLLHVLDEHPEWRAELRRRLLGDDLLELPALIAQQAEQLATLTARVDQIAEQLATLTARVDQIAEQLATLTARVDQIAEQLATLTARVDQIAEQLATLTARVDQIAEQLATLTARVDQLAVRVDQIAVSVGDLQVNVGDLKGRALEQDYRTKAPAYFGQVMRGARVVDSSRLADLLDDALDAGAITDAERLDALRSDLVVSGRRRDTGADVYLVIEVSAGIRQDDVQRAIERARILAKLGRPAYPVVAGQAISGDAAALASDRAVWQVYDGRTVLPAAS